MSQVVEIQKAIYVGGFKLDLKFSDGIERQVDFEPFLKRSNNPMTRKYLNEEFFKQFEIVHGDLVWNDYEMCFPIWDLHEGEI